MCVEIVALNMLLLMLGGLSPLDRRAPIQIYVALKHHFLTLLFFQEWL